MPISKVDREVVEGLFKAMQAGPEGADALMNLFAEDAVFVEPFSGQPHTHEGKDKIRASFLQMFEGPQEETKLVLDRVDLDGQQVRAEWTCTSPAFPTPMRGHDLFTIVSGKIKRLEVVVTDMPQMRPS